MSAISPAASQEYEIVWKTYADPSFVHHVRNFDNRTWCATAGGIVIFDPSDSSFTTITTSEGMPENQFRDVAVEENGRIWAATENLGLVSFRLEPEPTAIRHFTGTSVVFDQMTSLDVDGDLVVYGTRGGAGTFFNGLPGEQFTEGPGALPDPQVNDVAIDGDFVWFATDSGVALLFPDGSFQNVNSGLTDLAVYDVLVSGADKWVATGDGVYSFDSSDSSWQSTGTVPSVQLPVRSLAWDGTTLFNSGENGVMENPTGASWSYVDQLGLLAIQRGSQSIYNLGTSRVLTLAASSDGTLWCGTGNTGNERGINLCFFDGTTWKNLAPNAPLHNVFIGLSVGPDNTLWASHTTGLGISFYRESRGWDSYTELRNGGNSGLSLFGFQFCLLADVQGELWSMALSNPLDQLTYGSLDTKADDIWTYFGLGEGTITSNRYLKAVEDPAGNRWFLSDGDPGIPTSTNEGIDILTADGLTWKSVKTTDGNLGGRALTDAEIYPNGDAYLALPSVGVQEWATRGLDKSSLLDDTNDSWNLIVPAGDLPSDKIRALAGSQANLWIGTDGGLVRLEWQTLDLFTIGVKVDFDQPGLVSGEVNDLLIDSRGNLWVATEAGINVLWQEDPDRIEAFTTNLALRRKISFNYPPQVISPLVESTCLTLAESNDGRFIFVGTRKGMSRLEFRETVLAEPDLEAIYLYPNPVNAAHQHTTVKIGNLDREASIRVYSLEGDLVHEQDGVASDEVIWDLTTLNGFKARSGTYLVRIEVDGAAAIRVLAVAK